MASLAATATPLQLTRTQVQLRPSSDPAQTNSSPTQTSSDQLRSAPTPLPPRARGPSFAIPPGALDPLDAQLPGTRDIGKQFVFAAIFRGDPAHIQPRPTSRSAPPARRARTAPTWPDRAAVQSGACPSRSPFSRSAPLCRSSSTRGESRRGSPSKQYASSLGPVAGENASAFLGHEPQNAGPGAERD